MSIFLDIGSFVLKSSVNHIILNVDEKKSYEIRKLIEDFTVDQIKNFVIYGRLAQSRKIFIKKLIPNFRLKFIKKVQESFDNTDILGNLENASFIFITNVSRNIIQNECVYTLPIAQCNEKIFQELSPVSDIFFIKIKKAK